VILTAAKLTVHATVQKPIILEEVLAAMRKLLA